MENVDNVAKILNDMIPPLRDLGLAIASAKNLVDEGKEVLCSRKLQGAAVKYSELEAIVVQALKEIADGDVASENSEESVS